MHVVFWLRIHSQGMMWPQRWHRASVQVIWEVDHRRGVWSLELDETRVRYWPWARACEPFDRKRWASGVGTGSLGTGHVRHTSFSSLRGFYLAMSHSGPVRWSLSQCCRTWFVLSWVTLAQQGWCMREVTLRELGHAKGPQPASSVPLSPPFLLLLLLNIIIIIIILYYLLFFLLLLLVPLLLLRFE